MVKTLEIRVDLVASVLELSGRDLVRTERSIYIL